MDSTPELPGNQSLDSTPLAVDLKGRNTKANHIVAIVLWIVGLIALVIAAVIVRLHPGPWPFDLQTTITLQQLQPQLPFWMSDPIVWASLVDNPYPTAANFIAWFVVLLLIGVVTWRRGGPPIPGL